MDKFTNQANKVIKNIKPVKKSEENAEEQDPEEKKMGLDKKTIATINVASKLATRPGRMNLPFIGAQAQMNGAYGNLMKAMASKINKISANLK